MLDLPALPYANCGVLLVDTARYLDEDLSNRAYAHARLRPETILFQEQSALNGVLQGHFARLSPGWNWTLDSELRYLSPRFPVRLRHFAGEIKPWQDPQCVYDARFRLSYETFLREWLPEAQPRVETRVLVGGMHPQTLAAFVQAHLKARKSFRKALAPYRNEFEALTAP
jgi:lipopolysaccharide biosynthesis glycosyltransferase